MRAYGPTNGYGWKLDEVIGAQIVSVPMSVPIRTADIAFRTMMTSLVGVFLVMLLILNALLWLVVIRPLRSLSAMADQVSTGNFEAPEVKVAGQRRGRRARRARSTGCGSASTKALRMLDNA